MFFKQNVFLTLQQNDVAEESTVQEQTLEFDNYKDFLKFVFTSLKTSGKLMKWLIW